MHELSICQSIMQQLEQIAKDNHADQIDSIYLQIGPLSGVEAELLKQAFPLAAAGSCASQAQVHIEQLPIRVHCETCGEESSATANRLLCGACGDYHTRVISGDEMLLNSVELTKRSEEMSYV
jgi:hydrogenase nickel incorporation protein HypA/HybF